MRALVLAAVLASAATAHARGAVSITFTSSAAPSSTYAPNNVLAVWIEGPGGTFIKTIDRQALVRVQYLTAWRAKAGTNDMDAVTGATRVGYAAQTVTWNLQDKSGVVVPDGTYTIRMELAQSNGGTNNLGTFTFNKNGTASNQTGLANGGFTNVTINYNPTAPACNDGILDAPETCDPGIPAGQANSCPTTCMASGDACRPNRKNPDPAQACNMTCIIQPIIECKNFDGCCAEGCTEANDADCVEGGGSGSGSNMNNPDGGMSGGGDGTQIGNGCSTTSGASMLFALLLVAGASRSTRRRGA